MGELGCWGRRDAESSRRRSPSSQPPLALPEQEKTRGRSSMARGLVREGRRSPARGGGGAAARGRFQARCAAAATRGERRLLFLFRMGKEEVRFW